MIDEEAIYYALAELMSTVRWTRAGDTTPSTRKFVTISRRVKLFADVGASQQPACFQAEWASDEQQTSNLPYKTTLMANWIIYQCVANDPKGIGAIENNLILKGVRAALAPKPNDIGFSDKRNTLNGLVYHCFIQGRLFRDPGDIDGQGMLIVPIKLLVP